MAVTIKQVQQVTGSGTGVDMTAYIADAEALTGDLLSGCGYSAARLDSINKYLAAHLYLVTSEQGRGPVVSEKIGDAAVSYSGIGVNAKGLSGSEYGRTAMMLDTCGVLEGLGKPKAQFKIIGGTV